MIIHKGVQDPLQKQKKVSCFTIVTITRIKWFSYYPACRSQKGRGNVKRDVKLGRKNERRKSKSKRKDWNGNSSERKNEKRRNESEK